MTTTPKLAPKHVLVTGGADGLGKILAAQLVARGHAVTILSINEHSTRRAAREIGAQYVVADVRDWEQVGVALAQVHERRPIDVLINNAGVWTHGQLEHNSPEVISYVMEVNALGTMLVTRMMLPLMKARRQGRIVNVISQDAYLSKRDRSVYAASKWAVRGFTQCLHDDLAGGDVTVTGVYPGLMKTGLFVKNGVRNRDMSEAVEPEVVAREIVNVVERPLNAVIPTLGVRKWRPRKRAA